MVELENRVNSNVHDKGQEKHLLMQRDNRITVLDQKVNQLQEQIKRMNIKPVTVKEDKPMLGRVLKSD